MPAGARVIAGPAGLGGGKGMTERPRIGLYALPIAGGPLRGARWLPGARGKILRHLLGTYEARQSRLIGTRLSPGDVVFDIGANTGHYTLLAARLVGVHGRVFAFEPDARNRSFLEAHIRLNGVSSATVIAAAAGATDGDARFGQPERGSGTQRLSELGDVSVAVRSVDSVAAEFAVKPNLMKIDVEGAEASVLEGADEVLRQARPVVLLSIHGKSVRLRCLELLRGHGYLVEPLDPSEGRKGELICLPGDGP